MRMLTIVSAAVALLGAQVCGSPGGAPIMDEKNSYVVGVTGMT